jgi:phospho-N-acetylmuramoyl-pentapeptide-transferase
VSAVASVLALVPVCFAGGMLWGPWLIEKLRDLRFGKQIRLEGQEHHLAKAGTPTMGGALIVVTSLVALFVFVRDARVVVPLTIGVLLYAVFGAVDDYVNMKNKEGLGLQVRYQLIWQLLIALAVGGAIYWLYDVDQVRVPLLGVLRIGVWMVPLAVLVVLATTSGSNLIDGLDGLCAGTNAFAFLAYMVIALRRADFTLAAACAATIGALLAYLWFNVHPARVFMGGVGSLALGAGLAAVALLSGDVLLLPVIALPIVATTISVILQVGYFKLTHGKRIFRRAPLHHHFELLGVPEVNIVFRYWLVAAVCAAVGLLLAEL